jgi:hypothetical protein
MLVVEFWLAVEPAESRVAATPTIQPRARQQPRRQSARTAPRSGRHKNCSTPAAEQAANSIPAEARLAADTAHIPVQEQRFLKVRRSTDACSRRYRRHSLPPTGWARSLLCLLAQCRIEAKNRRRQECSQPPRLTALSAARSEPREFFDVPTRRTSPLSYPLYRRSLRRFVTWRWFRNSEPRTIQSRAVAA